MIVILYFFHIFVFFFVLPFCGNKLRKGARNLKGLNIFVYFNKFRADKADEIVQR